MAKSIHAVLVKSHHWEIAYHGDDFSFSQTHYANNIYYGVPVMYVCNGKIMCKSPSVKLTRLPLELPDMTNIDI